MPIWEPNTLETVKEFLEKARRRLSDENPDYADSDEQEELDEDSESSDDETDDVDQWLAEHGEEKPPETDEEAEPLEDEEQAPELIGEQEGHDGAEPLTPPDEWAPSRESAPSPIAAERPPAAPQENKQLARPPVVRRPGVAPAPQAPGQQVAEEDSDDLQPTREELTRLREYTRPWTGRTRDKTKLEAEAHVNPELHHQGHLIEARNMSHADRQKAYHAFSQSPDFQNADPITQMEMESKFHEDWHKQNPEHLMNALTAGHEAHQKGSQAYGRFKQVKDEKLRHIVGGGAQPGSMSVEEGMQHVGGSREDEDSAPSGIQQDKSAQFASGNRDFVEQYMKDREKKGKKFSDAPDWDEPEPAARTDVNAVLGTHPTLQDPAKKRAVDQFVSKYYPQIGKAARHVLGKLGLNEKAKSGEIDSGILHEAGMHALFQSINDYDHDHHSKAKFTTHLANKMRGLMQTALKRQDEIPTTMRAGAKQFDTQRRAENAAPVKHTNKEGVTTIINPAEVAAAKKRPAAEIAQQHHPDIQDRLQRVAAVKAPMVRRQAAQPAAPAAPKPPGPKLSNVRYSSGGEGEE
jgi:hypothetical protein